MAKRFFDIIFSLFGLVVLSPLIIILSFFIRRKLGSPVFFSQNRPGRDGKIFKMIKFRSMLDSKDVNGALLSDSERLTNFGIKLRNTSLDELPELWNVLKGDMSLVGPRPLLVEYLPLYSEEQAERHLVKPGITGWAQVNGRNAITWDEKFKLDNWYVHNHTVLLDIKIIFLTIKKVIYKQDISADGHATMPVFEGSNKMTGNKDE